MNWLPVKYFPLEKDLSELTAYLRQRGLVHRITEENGQQLLAVVDEQVIASLQEFLHEYEQGRVQFNAAHSASLPGSSMSTSHVIEEIKSVPVIVTLIVLSFIGFFIAGSEFADKWLFFFPFYQVAMHDSYGVDVGWRFVTPAFLHFSLLHVLFNCLWLWELGRRLEHLQGKLGFLVFFVCCASFSNIVQYIWLENVSFGGMSGVVYALVGFIAVRQKIAPNPYTNVQPALIGIMLFFLVLGMVGALDFLAGGPIGNAAHLGGLIAGILYALVTRHFYHR